MAVAVLAVPGPGCCRHRRSGAGRVAVALRERAQGAVGVSGNRCVARENAAATRAREIEQTYAVWENQRVRPGWVQQPGRAQLLSLRIRGVAS